MFTSVSCATYSSGLEEGLGDIQSPPGLGQDSDQGVCNAGDWGGKHAVRLAVPCKPWQRADSAWQEEEIHREIHRSDDIAMLACIEKAAVSQGVKPPRQVWAAGEQHHTSAMHMRMRYCL